uniref:DNA-directed RNA polymerase n=1 Tax=viral metagenome TaxID=1070528 RepID=A0A6C0CRN4_9ZZZZ
MGDQLPQIIIDKLFEDNPNLLVNHHLLSYNEFFNDGIKRIFREKNPIKIMKEQDEKTGEFNLKCNLFLAGKNGDKLYYGKPIIFDDNREHLMYPNEARLRNMTYGITIHYDVDVEFFIKTPEDAVHPTEPTYTTTLSKIFLGRFPIMLFSDLCILKNLTPDVRFELGECRNDYGGYFIIDGKEKVIISQEKFADNMLYIKDKGNDLYSHSAEIRSVSEDASKPIRTLSVRMVAATPSCKNGQIVVNIPNVRKPVPLFIVMRALGVISDKSIIEHCLLDMDKYSSYVDLFIPSIHDTGTIFSQEIALKYIASFTKGKTIPHALEILSDYFLTHVGEMNFIDKAYFLGHMVRELLRVYTKDKKPTDRDSFKFKRVELPGSLLYDLFIEYYRLQQKNIYQNIDKEYTFKRGIYSNNFTGLIENNYREFFGERIVETGFRKAFKGNWGSEEHTKRLGVVQGLNRLSYNSAISHLRKINLPLDSSAKVIGPRLLHSSQWGIIDPVDTPDGGNVGLHKHMAISAAITTNCSSKPMINWLRSKGMRLLQESDPLYNGTMIKIIVNGNWIGVISNPAEIISQFKMHRRVGMIPIFTSIQWDIANSTINIYTDAGRLCRPIFYIENGKPSFANEAIQEKISTGSFTWNQLISGFSPKKESANYDVNNCTIYNDVSQLYDVSDISKLQGLEGIIDYIDTAETEGSLIAFNSDELNKKPYTHMEIHPSLIFGVMGNQVVFPENNQLPRDLFACGQMRQAVSLYHSNYQNRIDKMGVILNYGETPLIKSRYLDKICKEQHPYGLNVIVAIMCYGGYNVEDSILFNEGSVNRGMFRTTYYNMYESREESSKVGNGTVDSQFANIEQNNVIGLKPGFDYSHLDKNGLAKENTLLDDKKIIIGKINSDPTRPDYFDDASVAPKKGQLGFVDKAFITEGEEGFRIAKVRCRHERIPNIGDKFCSRCGQKGTIGLLIPEADMPFTKDGIRPDIIINPHAIPSRMTIGQLVEALMGKACAMYGGFGDCTAFMNKGQKATTFGELLTNVGFHSSGNEQLYNGQSGEQLQAQIYIGPTYYMRLKHMVKDKINHRARGPRTLLTRQTVQGRANDGGLRVGEMERDGITGHGAAHFLNESMMVRGDEYFMAVCNKTGMTAIYNESKNLFLSPQADGPIRFVGTLENGMNIDNVTKYGRSFSVIRVPYAFKLLMQELQTMNVQMRIITEDNIDQLNHLAFSDNIVRLAGKGATPQSVLTEARAAASRLSQPFIQKGTPQKNPYDSPSPTSPVYDPNKPDYLQEQPLYATYQTNEGEWSPGPTMPMPYAPDPNKPLTPSPPPAKLSPEQMAWEFDRYGYEEGDVWKSIIIDDNGKPSQTWWVDDNNYRDPYEFPKDWVSSDLVRNNGEPIAVWEVVMGLRADKQPGNWKRVISRLRDAAIPAVESPKYNPISPSPTENYVPISPDYPPDKPPLSPLPEVSPEYVSTPSPPIVPVPFDPDSPVYRPGDYNGGGASNVKPPAINININVPKIGGDEEKPSKSEVEDITDTIKDVKQKSSEPIITVLKPPDGKPSDNVLAPDQESISNDSDRDSDKSGGQKKTVSFNV